MYRRFEGLQYPRNAQSYSSVYNTFHRRLKHSCFWNTTLRRRYIGNIFEEFAVFIFRAVQNLFLDYHEDGKKLFRNDGTYTRRHQLSSQHTSLWLSPEEAATSKGRYTLVTLPRNVTPYRDSVDGTCDHVTYQKMVTPLRYGLFGVLSVFGRRIKGMVRLRSGQVWTGSVTRHHRPLLP